MKSQGSGINEDVSFTLNSTDEHAIAFHARQDPCPSDELMGAIDTDGTSRAVAFNDVSQTLTSGGTGERGHQDPTNTELVAAFSAGQSEGAGTIAYQEEQSPTLRGVASGTNQVPALVRGMQVRRLTPTECSRLQGFPDDYLDIEYRGKPAADGPKYKALGNSMAVPCMRWIGQRIKTAQ